MRTDVGNLLIEANIWYKYLHSWNYSLEAMAKLMNNDNTTKKLFLTSFGFVIFLALIVRLAYINELPAALFGDVIEHLRMARDHNVVRWGGDGALFPLITSITTTIGGLSFLTLKLTSVVISVTGVGITMAYALTLTGNFATSIFSGMFIALSFWDISISHQGKPYALVPLFAVLTAWLVLTKRRSLAGISIGLSLYTQAAAWGLAVVSFMHPLTLFWSLVSGSYFFKEFLIKPENFVQANSHIGEKLAMQKYLGGNFLDAIHVVGLNYFKQIRGVFIYGDQGFRSTIPGQAHVDEITALFMLMGFIVTMMKWKKGIHLVIFFLLIQLPAALDINNPGAVPNHGRTVGVVPFLSVWAGIGLSFLLNKMQALAHKYTEKLLFRKKLLHLITSKLSTHAFLNPSKGPGVFSGSSTISTFTVTLAILLFTGVAYLNLHRYWVIYPRTLPNKNIPFAEIIASNVSRISEKTPVFLYGCCWGEWGQVEPGAFEFLATNGHDLSQPLNTENLCLTLEAEYNSYERPVDDFQNLTNKEIVIISSPLDTILSSTLSACGWTIVQETYISANDTRIAKQTTVTKLTQ